MLRAETSLLELSEWQGSPARLRAETNFALRNPGFVTTVGFGAGTRENEMVFWHAPLRAGEGNCRPIRSSKSKLSVVLVRPAATLDRTNGSPMHAPNTSARF